MCWSFDNKQFEAVRPKSTGKPRRKWEEAACAFDARGEKGMGHNGVVEVVVDRYHVKLVWPGSVGARETALQGTFSNAVPFKQFGQSKKTAASLLTALLRTKNKNPSSPWSGSKWPWRQWIHSSDFALSGTSWPAWHLWEFSWWRISYMPWTSSLRSTTWWCQRLIHFRMSLQSVCTWCTWFLVFPVQPLYWCRASTPHVVGHSPKELLWC